MDAEGTVFIIDPDDTLRSSLQDFLEAMSIPTRGFSSAEEFLDAWDESQAGCLLTELFLSGMSGIDLQQKLNSYVERLPIVFISEHADVATAVQAVQGGAVGFLTKPFSKHILLENLRAALARDSLKREKQHAVNAAEHKISALTKRERQLLEAVVHGMKNRQIADKLDLSLKTVEMHRSRMMKKMDAETVADLIRLYLLAHPETLENKDFFLQPRQLSA